MKHLRTKILLILLGISLLPLLMATIYSCKIANDAIRDKVNTASMSTLDTISRGVDGELYRLISEMNLTTTSREFQEVLIGLRQAKTDGETWVLLRKLDSLMLGVLGKSPAVGGIYLTLPNKSSYAVTDKYRLDLSTLPQQSWFQSAQNNDGTLKHCGMIPLGRNQEPALVFGKELRDTSAVGDFAYIGSIHFALNPSLLTALSAQNGEEGLGSCWLFDTKDQMISEPDASAGLVESIYMQNKETILREKSGIQTVYVDGQPVVMLHELTPRYHYRILYLIPNRVYSSEVVKITWITLLFAVVCAMVVGGLSVLVSRGISQPILELNRAMKRTESGSFDISLPVRSRDEIGQVVAGFNKMVARLKQVFALSIEHEKKKKELEISALQYQINPHFLYNLLASIRSLALVEGALETAELLVTAARLMKSTVGQAGAMIPLAQEVENIERFLYIQNLCHNGAIEWNIDLPAECRNCRIPNLALQPIVENSVFYGATPETGRVRLEIAAAREGDALVLAVSDHGPGIDPDKLQQIFSAPPDKNRLTHVGLKNTHERIRLNFGEGYGITITSGEGGARVLLRLPYDPGAGPGTAQAPAGEERTLL